MGKHVVYLRALDEAALRAEGLDPKWWIKDTIKRALDARNNSPAPRRNKERSKG